MRPLPIDSAPYPRLYHTGIKASLADLQLACQSTSYYMQSVPSLGKQKHSLYIGVHSPSQHMLSLWTEDNPWIATSFRSLIARRKECREIRNIIRVFLCRICNRATGPQLKVGAQALRCV